MTLHDPSDCDYLLVMCVFSMVSASFTGGSGGSRGRPRCEGRHAAVSEGGLPGRQARCQDPNWLKHWGFSMKKHGINKDLQHENI